MKNRTIEVVCPQCKKTRSVAVHNTKKSCYTGLCAYCSRRAFTGEKHHNWKGGIRTSSPGYYKAFYSPDHPNAVHGKYVLEHRLVMEEKLGRLLKKNEIVHHLNGIKYDNRPENLVVTSSHKHDCYTIRHLLQKRIRELEQLHLQLSSSKIESDCLKAVGEWLVWAKNPINVVPHGFTYIDGGVLNQAIKELSKGKPPEGMRSRYDRRSERKDNPDTKTSRKR